MQNTLKNLIETCQNVKPLEIRNQKFFNEIIFENILSAAIFDQVSISNFEFEELETEFLGGHFRDCIFKNCRFQNTLLHDINFKATIINGLKTQNTTGSDLHFNKKFPMYFLY
jgi:uncharacterized protein YjbI with pentapeptide repeats